MNFQELVRAAFGVANNYGQVRCRYWTTPRDQRELTCTNIHPLHATFRHNACIALHVLSSGLCTEKKQTLGDTSFISC